MSLWLIILIWFYLNQILSCYYLKCASTKFPWDNIRIQIFSLNFAYFIPDVSRAISQQESVILYSSAATSYWLPENSVETKAVSQLLKSTWMLCEVSLTFQQWDCRKNGINTPWKKYMKNKLKITVWNKNYLSLSPSLIKANIISLIRESSCCDTKYKTLQYVELCFLYLLCM